MTCSCSHRRRHSLSQWHIVLTLNNGIMYSLCIHPQITFSTPNTFFFSQSCCGLHNFHSIGNECRKINTLQMKYNYWTLIWAQSQREKNAKRWKSTKITANEKNCMQNQQLNYGIMMQKKTMYIKKWITNLIDFYWFHICLKTMKLARR